MNMNVENHSYYSPKQFIQYSLLAHTKQAKSKEKNTKNDWEFSTAIPNLRVGPPKESQDKSERLRDD